MIESIREFLNHTHNLQDLIRWGGYTLLCIIVYAETGLLAGFFLPGDSLLVTAGLLCALDGHMHPGLLIALLSIAAIAGDNTGYAIGKFIGRRLFTKEDSFFFKKSHIERTRLFYEKYGPKTIIMARFIPIIRTFAPTIAGVGTMRYAKFLAFSVFGGLLWVSSMVLTGFFLARSIPNVEKKIHWIILIVIFISFIPVLKEFLQSRKKNV